MKSQEAPNQKIKNKINGLILADCYIFSIFVCIFITELLPAKSSTNNGMLAGMIAMLNILYAPLTILETIIFLSIVALPIFGIWALLRKFVLKNFSCTETTLQKVRKTSIILCIVLILILIIQGMQY